MSSDESDYYDDLKEFNTKVKSKSKKASSSKHRLLNDFSESEKDRVHLELENELSLESENELSNSDISFDDDTDISDDDNDDSINNLNIKPSCKEVSTRVKKKISKTENIEYEDDEQKQFADLRAKIADMPFMEVQQLKEKLGNESFNQIMNQGRITLKEKKKSTLKKFSDNSKDKKLKNEDSYGPMEISSKNKKNHQKNTNRPNVAKTKVHRDPRFDNLSGEYNDEIYQKSYSFMSDIKDREKKKLLKEIKSSKDDERKAKMKELVVKINESENRNKQKMKSLTKKREIKLKEREMVSQGKRPFYLKKSVQNELDLSEKYKELKEKGNLDKYMSKKRKKSAAKDRKNMPESH